MRVIDRIKLEASRLIAKRKYELPYEALMNNPNIEVNIYVNETTFKTILAEANESNSCPISKEIIRSRQTSLPYRLNGYKLFTVNNHTEHPPFLVHICN